MQEITLKAYAKINLSLEVIGRRDDGYHNIRSLMQGIGLYDEIRATNCPQNGTKYNLPHCTIDGIVVYLCTDAKTIPADMSNLAFRGIKAVLDAYVGRGTASDLPAELIVTIDKKLPVAAGIAGGSGNAAACMLGLNALLGGPFNLRELMAAGARVGADVPFSLMMNAAFNKEVLGGLAGIEEASPAAWVRGIGDIVTPAVPVRRYVIMVNPGIAVSTKEAYEALDVLQTAEGFCRADAEDPSEWPLFVNDFEKYTLKKYPEAARLRSVMETGLDADMILMSGSGPTMIAYYEDRERALSDFGRMKSIIEREKGWRAWLTSAGDHE